jgi:hypothetical protein
MENILGAVFNSESQAAAAWHALESLVEADTVGLNAGAISVSGAHQPAHEGTLGATAVGTLLGMLGGPVGLAIGAATGLALPPPMPST